MGGMIRAGILAVIGCGILLALVWLVIWLAGVVFRAPFR